MVLKPLLNARRTSLTPDSETETAHTHIRGEQSVRDEPQTSQAEGADCSLCLCAYWDTAVEVSPSAMSAMEPLLPAPVRPKSDL